jgi:hypothetical protein
MKSRNISYKSAIASLLEEALDKNQFDPAEVDTWSPNANLNVTLSIAEVMAIVNAQPQLHIGQFAIRPSPLNADKVWIDVTDGDRRGEGGEFPKDKLAKALEAFYEEEF